jgi:L,D-peptidoglycan transpeptidase YkuD (ErfK/YbiS/YcfS/YnhG family)
MRPARSRARTRSWPATRSWPRVTLLLVAGLALGLLGGVAAAPLDPASAAVPLPERMASTGGGTQLVTAVTSSSSNGGRDGLVTVWSKQPNGHWVEVGHTQARFGVHGLSDNRVEGDGTTPTGIYQLRRAFGALPNPGTKLAWNHIDSTSWWNENSLSSRYNTWYPNCPASICWDSSRAHSSEHLTSHLPQYNYAAVVEFNTGATKVRPPSRPSGSGIFLHVHGSGYTAGCVSVGQAQLASILRWLDPAAKPHIAIGNAVSILRF